ncbi:hypothetical protein [Facilibium subflavum]|uniref:hypothetical protein n=1 Tax=Facilibium subflavum TaxID=2219058 RepID=UPI0013C2E9D8|nr:hypothetical protein [Facilibium subflavum]
MRYYYGPEYFLNYHTRHQAKTLGFFATTNVTGQFISFLFIVSLEIGFRYKKTLQILLLLLLITTMARSAMIALTVVFIMKFLLQKAVTQKDILFKIAALFLCFCVIFFFLADPLHLRSDGSLQSKIDFFKSALHIFDHSTVTNHIFGYGNSYQTITKVLDVNGWSPHVSILKAYLYYGLIGVGIYIFILLQFYFVDKKMKYPILTYIIFSLAGAPIFWPTFVVGVMLLKLNQCQVVSNESDC